MTTNTVSIRNSTRSHNRAKHIGTLLHFQVNKPYIAFNSEAHIYIRQQELRTYKRLIYECYCKELYIVKHKSRYSCESMIYFNLDAETIKENCNFKFYYNKTDITPTVLDGGNEIILPNWPNDKHIICNINKNIPVKIPRHPYILVNRSVLCNWGIEAENYFLLESLAAFENASSKFTIYFTVSTAFVNYLDKFSQFDRVSWVPSKQNRTVFKQTLPISLKEFINSYTNHKEIFDLQERHDNMELNTNKNFFSWKLHCGHFHVYVCNNFPTGYNFDSIFIM